MYEGVRGCLRGVVPIGEVHGMCDRCSTGWMCNRCGKTGDGVRCSTGYFNPFISAIAAN